jgi:hypothetical protein
MSIVGILTLVLIAAVVVSILFVVFKMFFALLPAIVVVVLVIWLIGKFSKDKDQDEKPANFFAQSGDGPERKKAENFKVTFEDDDDDKKEDDHK